MMEWLIILTIATTTNIHADTVFLKQGEQAPTDGYHVDVDTMKKIRKDGLERDAYKKENESLNKSLELQNLSLQLRKEQVDMLTKDSDRLAERLRKSSQMSTWERVGWFGLGILATGLALDRDLFRDSFSFL